jgi:hypothetical protein
VQTRFLHSPCPSLGTARIQSADALIAEVRAKLATSSSPVISIIAHGEIRARSANLR